MENCESYDEGDEETNESDSNDTDNNSSENNVTTSKRRRLAKTEIVPALPYARGDYGNALC